MKWDSVRDCYLEVEMNEEQQILEVYTVEGEQREVPNTGTRQNFSTIKKYGINISLLH